MLGLAKAIDILRFASWYIMTIMLFKSPRLARNKKLEEEINEEKDMAHFANPVVSPWR